MPPVTTTTKEAQDPPAVRAESNIIRHSASSDPANLQAAIDAGDRRVLKAVIPHASLAGVQCLVQRRGTLPNVHEYVANQAAIASRPDIVQWLLERDSSLVASEDLRYFAISGGVPVWELLIKSDPNVLKWDIGQHGNALGLAVAKRKPELVRFLIESGANVEQGNYVGLPVREFVKQHDFGEEMLGLIDGAASR